MNAIKNKFLQLFVKTLTIVGCKKKDMHITYHYSRKELKNKQVIVIGDHASYDMFYNIFYNFDFPKRLVPIVGSVHPRDPKMGKLLKLFEIIPKKMFKSDLKATIQIYRKVKEGACILLFPEGVCSNCGVTHPVNPAISGLLKNLNIDVIFVSSKGAFLSTPKYCKDNKTGPVYIDFYHLFSKTELKEKTEEEIYNKIMDFLSYNDFKWNSEHHFHYHGKEPNNKGIEKVIYHCPNCDEDGFLVTKENLIICENCHNSVQMDDTYAIFPATENDNLPYDRLDEWYLNQRRQLRQLIIENQEFSLSFDIELNTLNVSDYKSMFRPIGNGKITINRQGVSYFGTKNGDNIQFCIPVHEHFGACIQKDYYLVMYHGRETLAFNFKNDHSPLTVKACSAIEEFHALVNPKWDMALQRVFI